VRPIALCLGGAQKVWADLARAQDLCMGREVIVFACNFAGIQYDGHLDGWATLHPEMFADWQVQRANLGRNTDYRAFVHAARPSVSAQSLAYRWHGSSGLFMAQAAIEAMGAAGAILCGVPMDGGGDHIHWPAGRWRGVHHYQAAFVHAQEDGAPIRSMSGWSAEVLGAPDAAWLDSLAVPVPVGADGRMFIPAEAYLMHIRMLKKRNFVPPERRGLTFKYLEGRHYSVKRAWGEAMIARGEAVEVAAPPSPARQRQEDTDAAAFK
jgi:hypothetical protein